VDDYVEITNLGAAEGNLGAYRLINIATGFGPTIPLTDIIVPPGGQVLVHAGQNGTSTQTDVYLPTLVLTALGQVALAVPNTITNNVNLDRVLIDYVRWGSGATSNDDLAGFAIMAGLWSQGEFLPQMPDGFALEFCGSANQHGSSFWAVVSSPSPHEDGNCASPAVPVTWGMVKSRH
jgi:hypothetical protein